MHECAFFKYVATIQVWLMLREEQVVDLNKGLVLVFQKLVQEEILSGILIVALNLNVQWVPLNVYLF
jgi:hypothetical protein